MRVAKSHAGVVDFSRSVSLSANDTASATAPEPKSSQKSPRQEVNLSSSAPRS
jgi:hypothetical protein